MVGADRVALRRRFPGRAVKRVVGYMISAVLTVAVILLLFGDEPKRLPDGGRNPLAYLAHGLTVLLAIGLVPMLVMIVRRPSVTVDHYALTIRPGCIRTLVLPWARIAEVAGYSVPVRESSEPYLLVRYAERRGRLGDQPHWWDRVGLRKARRHGGGVIGEYDVAVRLDDFAGPPAANLARIGRYAPEQVLVANRLTAS